MFSSMTGTDADTAGVYLSMSNDNMEDAVNLFFNDPGLAAGMGAGSDVGVGGEGGMDTSESGVPVDLPVPPTDSGGGAAMRQPPMSPMSPMSPMGGQESDEAMAQRMAKEYAAMAGGGEDEVRRADDRKQDVLMGGGGMGGGGMGGYGGGYGGIGGVGGGLMDGGSAGFFDGGNAGNVQVRENEMEASRATSERANSKFWAALFPLRASGHSFPRLSRSFSATLRARPLFTLCVPLLTLASLACRVLGRWTTRRRSGAQATPGIRR